MYNQEHQTKGEFRGAEYPTPATHPTTGPGPKKNKKKKKATLLGMPREVREVCKEKKRLGSKGPPSSDQNPK